MSQIKRKGTNYRLSVMIIFLLIIVELSYFFLFQHFREGYLIYNLPLIIFLIIVFLISFLLHVYKSKFCLDNLSENIIKWSLLTFILVYIFHFVFYSQWRAKPFPYFFILVFIFFLGVLLTISFLNKNKNIKNLNDKWFKGILILFLIFVCFYSLYYTYRLECFDEKGISNVLKFRFLDSNDLEILSIEEEYRFHHNGFQESYLTIRFKSNTSKDLNIEYSGSYYKDFLINFSNIYGEEYEIYKKNNFNVSIKQYNTYEILIKNDYSNIRPHGSFSSYLSFNREQDISKVKHRIRVYINNFLYSCQDSCYDTIRGINKDKEKISYYFYNIPYKRISFNGDVSQYQSQNEIIDSHIWIYTSYNIIKILRILLSSIIAGSFLYLFHIIFESQSTK